LTRLPLTFYDNRLLFGRAAIPGQIAFEASDQTVRIYSREFGRTAENEAAAEARVSAESQPSHPAGPASS